MSEIERLHRARIAKEASARNQQGKSGERRDPTEWHPRGDHSFERVEENQHAIEVRSQPLNYGSLAHMADGVIEGIEAKARGDLIRTMDGQGITVDERAVKMHWQLVAEGYGFPYPEGFVHPEAPDDVKAEGREAWARVVKMAADSVTKYLYVKVWRRKNALPGGTVNIPISGAPKQMSLGSFMEVVASDDDVVEGEIVDDSHGYWGKD